MIKVILIFISVSFLIINVRSQVAPDTLCPSLVFPRINQGKWCMNGEIELYAPLMCVNSTGTYTWNIDSIYVNLGDGSEITTDLSSPFVYQYTTASAVNISAIGYMTNSNGDHCEAQVYNILNPGQSGNLCDVITSDTILYSSILSAQPYYSTMNLYSSQVLSCDSSLISLYHDLSYQPVLSPAPTWIYTLIIDGVIVQQDLSLPANNTMIYQEYLDVGQHTIEIVYAEDASSMEICPSSDVLMISVEQCPDDCLDCNTFKPKPGERYWVSAWVKENHPTQVIDYTEAHLAFDFIGSGQPSIQFFPSGDIIDNWQRIVGSFTIPFGTSELGINLVNGSSNLDSFFDDIRIHPYNASMKSYVYDFETFWLTAELDDNNYATFYEYDKEGQLIRIKKETARGIMTIQESRSSNPKVAID